MHEKSASTVQLMSPRSTFLALAALAGVAALAASGAGAAVAEGPRVPVFSLSQIFTLFFLTLGPLKVIGPFAAMTRGRDQGFKRQLALNGFVIAVIATVAASTVGVNILRKWGVSVEALLFTAGVVLFLVALRQVLEQYAPEEHHQPPSAAPVVPVSALAFTPLAFPTIVTPYGIAIVIALATGAPASERSIARVLGIAAIVLVLDLLAMLFADSILKTPYVAAVLRILGATLGVLQIALGIQAILGALRLMGVVGVGNGVG
jgi:multiple antibiotic resistance protein